MKKLDELSLKAMVKMGNLKSKLRREDGASAVEYGLLVGLIAVAIVTAIVTMGDTVKETFDDASSALNPTP